MNTRNFFYNAALVFGLAVTGPSFADEPVNADPSRMTQQEREAYRAEKQASMTPEQRAEKQASRSQGSGGQGQGTMSRDGSGSGGQYGRNGGGGGGGHGRGGR
ncbi:MAG: hypothetical protein Q7U78_02370 [Gallionella sp.]|nr:hypothetical protein [Gallionella sp.]